MEAMNTAFQEKTPQDKNHRCNFRLTNGQLCESAFVRASDLKRHVKIHTGEKEHKCTWLGCTKEFIQKSALTVHMRIHTGEKPHKCDICEKPFADSSSRARHRKIHMRQGHVPCTVPGCGKSYARKSSCVKHRKRVHNLGPESRNQLAASTPEMSHSTAPTPEQPAPLTPLFQLALNPSYDNSVVMPAPAGQQSYPNAQPAPAFSGFCHQAPLPHGYGMLPYPLMPPPAINHMPLLPDAYQLIAQVYGAPVNV